MEELCKKCDRLVEENASACECGFPTPKASFKERSEHEVREWRLYRARMNAVAS